VPRAREGNAPSVQGGAALAAKLLRGDQVLWLAHFPTAEADAEQLLKHLGNRRVSKDEIALPGCA